MAFFNLPTAFYIWFIGYLFTLALVGSEDVDDTAVNVPLALLFMFISLWIWPLLLGLCVRAMHNRSLKERGK
jgi:hypothetical protein